MHSRSWPEEDVMKTKEVRSPVRLLSVEELAGLLQVAVKTIYHWRLHGLGPTGIRVNGHVRYDPEDVMRWLDDRRDNR